MKKCLNPNCNNPIFSHGFCKYHYHYIPKKNKRDNADNKSQIELFIKIWNTKPHISELSGVDLSIYENTSYFHWMFAHVLDKKNFPLFKYEEDNIMLVEPHNEHRLLDQGTVEQKEKYNLISKYPANWDIFYQRREYLKQKYQEQLKQIL